MSFVIHIWESPLPRSIEEADSILDHLVQRAERAPQPRLEALRKALWERYPRDLDSDVEDPVWNDVLSAPQDGQPYESIGVMTDHLDEVVPFVVRTANGLGLVVYDPQFGTVYLPEGKILGNTPPQPQPAKQARVTEEAVTKELIELLKPYMATRGFAWRKIKAGDMRFVRAFEGGRHLLEPFIARVYEGIRVTVLIDSHLAIFGRVINGVLSPSSSQLRETLRGSLGSYLTAARPQDAERLLKYHKKDMLLTSMTEVRPTAEVLVNIFEGGLMQLLSNAETPQGYWTLALEELRGTRQPVLLESILCKLVAGRLCDDPVWSELASVEMARTHAQIESLRAHPKGPGDKFDLERLTSHLQDVQRLTDYLRTEFQPGEA